MFKNVKFDNVRFNNGSTWKNPLICENCNKTYAEHFGVYCTLAEMKLQHAEALAKGK